MGKFKKGDEVYISRKVFLETDKKLREQLTKYYGFGLIFDFYFNIEREAYVNSRVGIFSVPCYYLLTKKEYEDEINLCDSIQSIRTESKLKENISPQNTEYTFIPKSEVVPATVDGKEGFLIKK